MIETTAIRRKEVGYSELVDTLKKYDEYFMPRLSVLNDLNKWGRKLYEKGIVHYYLNEADAFVGMTAFYANDITSREGFLTLIFLDQQYQGRGLSEVLFDDVVRECKLRGMNLLKLEVEKENDSARRFYQRMGGTVISETSHSLFYSFPVD